MAGIVMRMTGGDGDADQPREVLSDVAYLVHTRDPGTECGCRGVCHVKCLTLEKPMAGPRDRVQRRPSAKDKPAQHVRSSLALDRANRCRGNESNAATL